MIPVRLRLRNFMSYRDGVTPVEFDGFQLACLSGNNGHGKSALLDAITWSLWGRARAKSEDDLIHHGCAEMEVEFEFDLNGNRYRVLRKRQLRKAGGGVRGVPALEFQVRSETGYRAITGDSVTETERKIRETLGLDYETFVNSSLILQGRADAFTTKTPAERKKVLSELLNLGLYDRLEERAREQVRALEAESQRRRAELDAMEQQIARRPEHVAEEARLAAEVERLEDEAKLRDADLRVAEAQVRELEGKQEHLRRLESDIADTGARIQELDREMSVREAAIADARKIVDRRDEIESAVARRDELERRNDELTAVLQQRNEAERRRDAARREIEHALVALQRSASEERGRLVTLKRRASQVEALAAEQARLRAELRATDGLEAERDELVAELQSAKNRLDQEEATRERLLKDMNALKARLVQLDQAGATCPVCATSLNDDHRARVKADYESHGKQMADDFRASKRQSARDERERARLEARLAELDRKIERHQELQRAVAGVEERLRDAVQDRASLDEVEAALSALTARIEREEYAPEAHAALKRIEAELAALPYDRAEHEQVRRALVEARERAAEQQPLALAEQRIRVEREALDRAMEDHGRYLVKYSEFERRAKELREQIAELAVAKGKAQVLQAALEDAMKILHERSRAHAKAQQMIQNCDDLAKQAKAKRAELAGLQQRARDYRDLVQAFGKNGIQAMIIETAIPEIQDEANELLARLTDNRMSVKFETQRSAKSGDSVIETLDIRIADELGTRDYSLFSGGEAFRINLAIRIALSKLLCRRAGASLQTLIIDEGFGTQDQTGRERLVEAINRISADFEKIIVITHIDELKDMFPTRIEVLKTASGSQIVLN